MANTDAVVGKAVVGQTILSTWWGYPPEPGLGLVGGTLDAILGNVGPAGLAIDTYLPKAFVAPPAILGLRAIAPVLALSQVTNPVPAAGLGLGAMTPDYAGPVWLWTETCDTITLKPVECL